MYKVERLSPSVIRVEEITHSFEETFHRYTMINTDEWVKTFVYTDKDISVDDAPFTIKMIPADIAWTKRHYLSKL